MYSIRVFDVCRYGSHVLGPGRRYVLWTQGCLRRCQGCITPESRPLDGGVDIDIDALAYDIVSRPNIDGLTVSGGEPFLQAKGVGRLLELVHNERPEMTVIVYTGYQQEELDIVPDADALLHRCCPRQAGRLRIGKEGGTELSEVDREGGGSRPDGGRLYGHHCHDTIP